jgi:hexokinase
VADVPEDLLEQMKELERLFTVDRPKLKDITDHFVNELTKGEHSSASSEFCALLTRLKASPSKVEAL